MPDYCSEREAMVERQLRRRGITDQLILDAFLEVPREAFVGSEYAHLAYGDHPLPIEAGQTISQPYIVALMIHAAGVRPSRQGARGRLGLRLRCCGHQPDRWKGHRDRAATRPCRACSRAAPTPRLSTMSRSSKATAPLAVQTRAVRCDPGRRERKPRAAAAHRPAGERRQHRHADRIAGMGSGAGQGDEASRWRSSGRTSAVSGSFPLSGKKAGKMLDTELDILPRLIAEAAEPLPDIDSELFGAFFDRFGDARVVCLGEASHGTSEFYRARAAISRRLIERHGFNIVAVEGIGPIARRSIAMSVIAPRATSISMLSSDFRCGCGATRRSTPLSPGCAA